MSFPSVPGYELLEVIGQGAMGTVYKARQNALDRVVAVKILRPELAAKRRYLERLQREAKLTARLDHPNVVKGIDYGVAEGRPYFVMEYAEGKTLKDLLRERGRFSEREAIEIALQVARALEHAYRHGIVHRDVKPGNVILAPEGEAKLTDLGLARRPGDPTVTHLGATMGTPQYISPEQARNPSGVDVRSDIYSLGATLYHLVTGTPPFAGESLADLLTKVLFEKAEAASAREPSVSPGFSLVLRKMLAKEPGRRYQSPGELIEDLQRVRQREAPLITEKALAETPRPRVPPFALGAGAALALGVGAYLWLGRGQGPAHERPIPNSFDLARLRPSPTLPASELLDREGKVRQALNSLEKDDPKRGALEGVESEIQAEIASRVRRAAGEGGRRIAEEWKSRRFAEAETLLDEGLPDVFEGSFGAPWSQVKAISPFAREEWEGWLAKERRACETRLHQIVEAYSSELDRHLAQRTAAVLELVAARRFRAAAAAAEAAGEDFRSLDGVSLEDLPAEARQQVGSLGRFRAEIEGKIRSSSEELCARALESLGSAREAIASSWKAGSLRSPSSELEAEIPKILSRLQLKPSELLAEDALRLDREIGLIRGGLQEMEEKAQREAALRVVQDLDREFAPSLRKRDYGRVLEEWRRRAGRPLLAPAAEEIEVRIEELGALVSLREKFGRYVQASEGKPIEVREGSIHKSGRVQKGFDFRTGEFVLEPENGSRLACSFASVHPETVGRFCGVVDPGTGREREGLAAEEIYGWAIFQLYEGQWAVARPLFFRLLHEERFEKPARAALARIEREEKGARESDRKRESEARELLDAARRFVLVGEFPNAQARLGQLLRDFSDVAFVRDQREALEAEAAEAASADEAARRAEALRAQFPGAEILPMAEDRYLLRYRFRGQAPSGWRMSESWVAFEGGVQRRTRCRDAQEFKAAGGPQVQLPLATAAGVRVAFRIAFPFDAGPPFFDCFTVAGHSFGVWSGGEDPVGQVASWGGGPELYEPRFRHPAWDGNGLPAGPRFRFLQGGSYEVVVEVLEGGKEAVFFIDGDAVARSRLSEAPAALRDRVEFRSWEAAELREVAVEGVGGGGK